MRFFHAESKTHAIFDDEHVVSYGGLAPALRLAERAGLERLADEYITLGAAEGANAAAKVTAIVAGMACGADSIDDLDMLRHGAMDKLFDGVRAPSTLGSFLRAFTWGNVRQLDKVARLLLVTLAAVDQGPVRGIPRVPGSARRVSSTSGPHPGGAWICERGRSPASSPAQARPQGHHQRKEGLSGACEGGDGGSRPGPAGLRGDGARRSHHRHRRRRPSDRRGSNLR